MIKIKGMNYRWPWERLRQNGRHTAIELVPMIGEASDLYRDSVEHSNEGVFNGMK